MLRPPSWQYAQLYFELLRADLLCGALHIDSIWLGVLADAVWRVGGVKIDWVAPLLIVGFTLLDGLQRWYWSFDRDVMENGLIEWRRISWGTIRACGRPEFDRRYFVMYFPGRHWERDGYRQEYAWHNRGVLWIQGERWREIFSRCT